jgi:NADPH:quinone reductase-like Zn-dependent oxidoreductase
VFLGPGRAEWQEATEPVIAGALEAIVEPVAVATCDLDVAILRGRFRAFPGPFPLGHEGVARVTDVGDAVSSVSPGDLVVVPFQICCGTCPGQFQPQLVTSRVTDWDSAAEALSDPPRKLVLTRAPAGQVSAGPATAGSQPAAES